jgi:hypothetical protein
MGARRITVSLLAAAFALAAMPLLAACGEEEEEETHVIEGEPIELGDLSYNVGFTRFLNPDDPEDAEYLVGQPEPAPGEQYLGVFMTVDNEGDATAQLPPHFEVTDTTHTVYESLESESPFALEPSTDLAAGEELPAPDTTAAIGPIKGSLVLFRVPDSVTENRPLELEIPSSEGDGIVELDI